ncbi:MAG: hypothetical protein HPY58_07435 [Firmicutes bacterium]|nr:hypothetical protein [Bacillota bacterium]
MLSGLPAGLDKQATGVLGRRRPGRLVGEACRCVADMVGAGGCLAGLPAPGFARFRQKGVDRNGASVVTYGWNNSQEVGH